MSPMVHGDDGAGVQTPKPRTSLTPTQAYGSPTNDAGQVSPHCPAQKGPRSAAPSPQGSSGGPSENTVASEYRQ